MPATYISKYLCMVDYGIFGTLTYVQSLLREGFKQSLYVVNGGPEKGWMFDAGSLGDGVLGHLSGQEETDGGLHHKEVNDSSATSWITWLAALPNPRNIYTTCWIDALCSRGQWRAVIGRTAVGRELTGPSGRRWRR